MYCIFLHAVYSKSKHFNIIFCGDSMSRNNRKKSHPNKKKHSRHEHRSTKGRRKWIPQIALNKWQESQEINDALPKIDPQEIPAEEEVFLGIPPQSIRRRAGLSFSESTPKELINYMHSLGGRTNIHHPIPRARSGMMMANFGGKLIEQTWSEIRVLQRKHVCFNILFEVPVLCGRTYVRVNLIPQEICAYIKSLGDERGNISFDTFCDTQRIAWREVFGDVCTVSGAMFIIMKEWNLNNEWHFLCPEILRLKTYPCGQYRLVKEEELKRAVALAVRRYHRRLERLGEKGAV